MWAAESYHQTPVHRPWFFLSASTVNSRLCCCIEVSPVLVVYAWKNKRLIFLEPCVWFSSVKQLEGERAGSEGDRKVLESSKVTSTFFHLSVFCWSFRISHPNSTLPYVSGTIDDGVYTLVIWWIVRWGKTWLKTQLWISLAPLVPPLFTTCNQRYHLVHSKMMDEV